MPVEETPLKPEVFDQLKRAMQADAAGLAALYRDFLADAWHSLQLLRDSIALCHFDDIRARAHYLKSGSLILGAQRVARDAANIEEASIAKDPTHFAELLRIAEIDMRTLQAELERKLGASVVPAGEPAA